LAALLTAAFEIAGAGVVENFLGAVAAATDVLVLAARVDFRAAVVEGIGEAIGSVFVFRVVFAEADAAEEAVLVLIFFFGTATTSEAADDVVVAFARGFAAVEAQRSGTRCRNSIAAARLVAMGLERPHWWAARLAVHLLPKKWEFIPRRDMTCRLCSVGCSRDAEDGWSQPRLSVPASQDRELETQTSCQRFNECLWYKE
jgi:hypothetical protein